MPYRLTIGREPVDTDASCLVVGLFLGHLKVDGALDQGVERRAWVCYGPLPRQRRAHIAEHVAEARHEGVPTLLAREGLRGVDGARRRLVETLVSAVQRLVIAPLLLLQRGAFGDLALALLTQARPVVPKLVGLRRIVGHVGLAERARGSLVRGIDLLSVLLHHAARLAE